MTHPTIRYGAAQRPDDLSILLQARRLRAAYWSGRLSRLGQRLMPGRRPDGRSLGAPDNA